MTKAKVSQKLTRAREAGTERRSQSTTDFENAPWRKIRSGTCGIAALPVG